MNFKDFYLSEEMKLLKTTRTGKLYMLDNGNILKITNDGLEYKNALVLIQNPSDKFVKYVSAKESKNKYQLEMERVELLNDEERMIVDLIQNSLGDMDYFLDDKRRNNFIKELKQNPEWYSEYSTYNNVYKLLNELYRIYKEGLRLKLELNNINSENLGRTKNNKLVAFDLGN